MPRRVIAAAVVLLLGVVAGCGTDEERPSAAEWAPQWEALRDGFPDPSEVLDQGEELCGDVLGDVRLAREEILPSPRPVLDETVSRWIGLAEGVMLDCPADEDDLADRYDDLEVVAGEIDGALEVAT